MERFEPISEHLQKRSRSKLTFEPTGMDHLIKKAFPLDHPVEWYEECRRTPFKIWRWRYAESSRYDGQ